MFDEAGGKQNDVTEAVPNELKLGEGGKVVRAGHRLGVGVGGVRQASLDLKNVGSELSECKRTHTRFIRWASL